VIRSDVLDAASPTPIAGVGYLNGKVYLEQFLLDKILVWNPTTHAVVTTLSVPPTLSADWRGPLIWDCCSRTPASERSWESIRPRGPWFAL